MTETLPEKLSARFDATRDILEALSKSATTVYGCDRSEIQALHQRIGLCNSPRNIWIIDECVNETTLETFPAIGQYWRCNSKLCPHCLAYHARRNRQRVRKAIAKVKPKPGERWNFITFTIPNPSASLVVTRSIVHRAWTLFRKRRLCADLIRGGVKTEEFTVTAKGFHYHIHFLALTKYFLYQEMRRVWTECVEISTREHEQPFEVKTKDGLCIVNVQRCAANERTIQEVCKYITKSDSWRKLNAFVLAEIALVRQWFRMTEFIGCLNRHGEASDAEPIVHTRSANDGEADALPSYWRDRVIAIGMDAYLRELEDEFLRCVHARRVQLERWSWSEVRDIEPFTFRDD